MPGSVSTTDPRELSELYAEAEEEIRKRAEEHGPLTADEWREQRINYVYGEIGERCGLSREEVEELIDSP